MEEQLEQAVKNWPWCRWFLSNFIKLAFCKELIFSTSGQSVSNPKKSGQMQKIVHRISPRESWKKEKSLQTIDFAITSPAVVVLIGCSAGQSQSQRKWVRSNKLWCPQFNTHCLTPKCSKSYDYHQGVSSRKIITSNKTTLCHQNCQPHIRCSEASKSSTLVTTSWQDLGDFNIAKIPCGSWEKYDLPISSRQLS